MDNLSVCSNNCLNVNVSLCRVLGRASRPLPLVIKEIHRFCVSNFQSLLNVSSRTATISENLGTIHSFARRSRSSNEYDVVLSELSAAKGDHGRRTVFPVEPDMRKAP